VGVVVSYQVVCAYAFKVSQKFTTCREFLSDYNSDDNSAKIISVVSHLNELLSEVHCHKFMHHRVY